MSENIEQKCLAKGVKLTEQRKIIAKIMSESNDHPDVDELYNRVSKLDAKKQWIIGSISPRGEVIADYGAIKAIRNG